MDDSYNFIAQKNFKFKLFDQSSSGQDTTVTLLSRLLLR